MNRLVNLARIITSRTLPSLPLLNLADEEGTKEMRLVTELVSNADASLNQLVRSIYGRNTKGNIAAFHQLSTRVQSKLLNHLFFLDHSDRRLLVSRRHEMNVLSLTHQASVLMAEGEYMLAEHLLRRCLRLAEKDEFPVYGVLAARQMRNLYVMKGNARAYLRMVAELARWQELQAWEDEAEHLHSEFRVAAGGTVAAQNRLLPRMGHYIQELDRLHKLAATFNTYFFLYRARLYQHQMMGNFEEIITITTEADQQLEAGTLNARRFDRRYNHFMQAYGYLGARRATEGLALAEEHLLHFHPSSTNWFAYQENHLLLALHADQPTAAWQVYQGVVHNEAYPKQREAARQRWDLYRVYLDLLLPASAPPPTSLGATRWTLTLPDFNRDKLGYHVAILVSQLLYFLGRRDLDEVVVRLERLRKYQSLHLRDTETLRSRLFMQLLALLGECDFNPRTCIKRGARLLEKLRETPIPGGAFAEGEIVPYERLWALTLELLRQGRPIVSNKKQE